MQYTSTAIVMPWEVGRLLLQVQWVPRDAGEPEPSAETAEEEDGEVCVPMLVNCIDLVYSHPTLVK
jgi:fusion and transport protein UGO1